MATASTSVIAPHTVVTGRMDGMTAMESIYSCSTGSKSKVGLIVVSMTGQNKDQTKGQKESQTKDQTKDQIMAQLYHRECV